MISPPYTSEFVNLFLPLIENEYINNTSKAEELKKYLNWIHHFLAFILSLDGDFEMWSKTPLWHHQHKALIRSRRKGATVV